MAEKQNRLLIKVTHDTLPQVKNRYPFIYLERGRMEIDDSSIKWIDSEGNIVRIPVTTISTILLGPGTSVTHEAIKVCSASNTTLCWVGEDSMLFYAVGNSPTANTNNFRRQMKISCDEEKSLEVARRMYKRRFPDEDLTGKTLKQMMGMEGYRVKKLYEEMAEKYKVGWKGRSYVPGKMELSDLTNQILTAAIQLCMRLFVPVFIRWDFLLISDLFILEVRCLLFMIWRICTKNIYALIWLSI